MAQRPKGCKSATMTAPGYVTRDPKNVYALVIHAFGATVGDMVALRDGGLNGETKLGPFWITAANGMWPIPLGRYGVEFLTDVYYAEVVTATGKIKVEVIYD
jgi:hypothetical protein